jgi:hypothetical protein
MSLRLKPATEGEALWIDAKLGCAVTWNGGHLARN